MPLHHYEELEHRIGRLTLRSGSGNPLTSELLVELAQRLSQLKEQPPRGLIFDAGDSKIFSGGFALPIIATWERGQIKDFFTK